MIGIYRIISPSNKIYIGQSINIKDRFSKYKTLNCKKQYILFNSLTKYGSENHIFEIIEECNINQLNERETYWKQYYINQLGWDKMLFCGLYDSGGGPKSEKTKIKISETLKSNNHSKYYTEELKHKLRKPKPKGFGEIISKINKGRKFTEKQKQTLKNNRINKGLKSILQFDTQGNFIKEWNSIKEINILNTTKNISACCRGKLKTVGGFVWQYKN